MEILPIQYSDIVEIGKELKGSKAIAVEGSIVKELLEHIRCTNGLALKLVVKGKIVGVWFSIEFDTHTSLSYFYLYPDVRYSKVGVLFFIYCFRKAYTKKPVLLKASTLAGFEKRVIHISGDVYQFIGKKQWVE